MDLFSFSKIVHAGDIKSSDEFFAKCDKLKHAHEHTNQPSCDFIRLNSNLPVYLSSPKRGYLGGCSPASNVVNQSLKIEYNLDKLGTNFVIHDPVNSLESFIDSYVNESSKTQFYNCVRAKCKTDKQFTIQEMLTCSSRIFDTMPQDMYYVTLDTYMVAANTDTDLSSLYTEDLQLLTLRKLHIPFTNVAGETVNNNNLNGDVVTSTSTDATIFDNYSFYKYWLNRNLTDMGLFPKEDRDNCQLSSLMLLFFDPKTMNSQSLRKMPMVCSKMNILKNYIYETNDEKGFFEITVLDYMSPTAQLNGETKTYSALKITPPLNTMLRFAKYVNGDLLMYFCTVRKFDDVELGIWRQVDTYMETQDEMLCNTTSTDNRPNAAKIEFETKYVETPNSTSYCVTRMGKKEDNNEANSDFNAVTNMLQEVIEEYDSDISD